MLACSAVPDTLTVLAVASALLLLSGQCLSSQVREGSGCLDCEHLIVSLLKQFRWSAINPGEEDGSEREKENRSIDNGNVEQ